MTNHEDDGSRFLVIYRFMWSEMGLSGVTLHVYARIYGFCRDGCGLFFESRNSSALFLGTTARTVSRSITELLSCGLIVERGERINPNGSTTRCYSINREAAARALESGTTPTAHAGASKPDPLPPDEAPPPDELSHHDDVAAENATNPDGTSGSPVTGCQKKKKKERKK